jgi:hypothetical protein
MIASLKCKTCAEIVSPTTRSSRRLPPRQVGDAAATPLGSLRLRQEPPTRSLWESGSTTGHVDTEVVNQADTWVSARCQRPVRRAVAALADRLLRHAPLGRVRRELQQRLPVPRMWDLPPSPNQAARRRWHPRHDRQLPQRERPQLRENHRPEVGGVRERLVGPRLLPLGPGMGREL